jgi:hypothetical protein
VVLPRPFVCCIAFFVPVPLPVLITIRDEGEDLMVSNPLILLANPFGFGWCTSMIGKRRVELAEALNSPTKIEDTLKYEALQNLQFEPRRFVCEPVRILRVPWRIRVSQGEPLASRR